VRIDELVWDEWNEGHVAKHRLDPEEVEEVVFDRASLVFKTKAGGSERRYLMLGLTEAGRYALVVLEPMSGNRAYVVTARDMTDEERRRFKSRGK
jgi:uncharacterized DUF497 family protein